MINKTTIRRARHSLAAVAVSAVMIAGWAVPASAVGDSGEDTPRGTFESHEPLIRERMTNLGIADATQDALLKKLYVGEAWDSMTGAEPVRTETWSDAENSHTRSIFADGSRSELTSQIPSVEAATGTRGSTCATPAGPYPYGWTFNGCRIEHSEPLLTLWYTINGRTLGSAAGYPAQITSVSPVYANVVGGTSNNHNKYIGRASASSSSAPAYAVGSVSVTYGGVASFSYLVRANVAYTIWASY